MKSNVSIGSLLRPLVAFVRRFHTLLFFLAVSGGLFAAIFVLLSDIKLSSTVAPSSDQTINGTFDEETIKRIEQDVGQTTTPGPRSSPFSE